MWKILKFFARCSPPAPESLFGVRPVSSIKVGAVSAVKTAAAMTWIRQPQHQLFLPELLKKRSRNWLAKLDFSEAFEHASRTDSATLFCYLCAT